LPQQLRPGAPPEMREGYALAGKLLVPQAMTIAGKKVMLECIAPTGRLMFTSDRGEWVRGRSPTPIGNPPPKTPGMKQGSRVIGDSTAINIDLDIFQSFAPPPANKSTSVRLGDRQQPLTLAITPFFAAKLYYQIPSGILGDKWIVRVFASPGSFLPNETDLFIWVR
jgi:hypothetical protein